MRAFYLTLPARPQSLRVVRRALDGIPGGWADQPTSLNDVQIAVTEACANVVMHAYPGRDDGMLEVIGELDDGKLTVWVRDHGPGMTPRADSPGLGVGLPLIVALTDELEIGRTAQGMTNVRMTFNHAVDSRTHAQVA
jgi:anti-sigma regulatory factor (Ser/Thr protein kinase)